MIKDKLFVICLPGNMFSGNFVTCLLRLLEFIRSEGGKYVVSNYYSPLVYESREGCINGSSFAGKAQLPFNGNKYDYMLWIDSDIIFTPQNFLDLVNNDKEICGGWYSQPHGETSVSNRPQFKIGVNGGKLTQQEIQTHDGLIDATISGFGFLLIKQGVFEEIDYPWFSPKTHFINEQIQYTEGEDGAFCRKAIEQGLKIYIDPKVRVGHEKLMVI